MGGKSVRLPVIAQQSTQNTANLPLQTYEKNRWTFFCLSTRASTLVSAITLLTQVPLQKFPFLFISMIPCKCKWSCLLLLHHTHRRTQLLLQILLTCIHRKTNSQAPHRTSLMVEARQSVSWSYIGWGRNGLIYCSYTRSFGCKNFTAIPVLT